MTNHTIKSRSYPAIIGAFTATAFISLTPIAGHTAGHGNGPECRKDVFGIDELCLDGVTWEEFGSPDTCRQDVSRNDKWCTYGFHIMEMEPPRQTMESMEAELSKSDPLAVVDTFVPAHMILKDGSQSRALIEDHQEQLRNLVDEQKSTFDDTWPNSLTQAGLLPDPVEEALDFLDATEPSRTRTNERQAQIAADQAELEEQERITNFRVYMENKRSGVTEEDYGTAYEEDRLADLGYDEEDRVVDFDKYGGLPSDDEGGQSLKDELPQEDQIGSDDNLEPYSPLEHLQADAEGEQEWTEAELALAEEGFLVDERDGGSSNDEGHGDNADSGYDGSDSDYEGDGYGEGSGDGEDSGFEPYDPQGHGADGEGDPSKMSPEDLQNWSSKDIEQVSEAEQFEGIWDIQEQGIPPASINCRQGPADDEICGEGEPDAVEHVSQAERFFGGAPETGDGADVFYPPSPNPKCNPTRQLSQTQIDAAQASSCSYVRRSAQEMRTYLQELTTLQAQYSLPDGPSGNRGSPMTLGEARQCATWQLEIADIELNRRCY